MTWLLVLVVPAVFAAFGWRILEWIDQLLDRRHHHPPEEEWAPPRSIRELTTQPYDYDNDHAA